MNGRCFLRKRFVRAGVRFREFGGARDVRERSLVIALGSIDEAAGIVGGTIVRLELDSFGEIHDSPIKLTFLLIGRSAVIVGIGILRRGADDTRAGFNSGITGVLIKAALPVVD